MLSSLEISNFRTFSHLLIKQLGRVNLVVGKNNVGKTTLLEALRLYGSIWPRSTVASILHERNEVGGSVEGKTFLLFHSLFHGRVVHEGDEIIIRDVGAGESGPAFVATARVEAGSQGVVKISKDMFYAPGGPAIDVKWPGREFTLHANGAAEYAIASTSPKPPEFSPDPPCLRSWGVQQGTEDTFADWWDTFSLTDAEQRVLNALQIIAPITGVRFVGDPRGEAGRMARVAVRGIPEPVALASLGDGVVRMFQIAVAMEYAALRARKVVNADPNLTNVFPLLLIDEVESGIHYTLHGDMWRFIFGAARLLDVQVFATSHSWDCIEGFQAAAAEDTASEGLLVRIESAGEKSRAVLFSEDELAIVTRENIEVR